MKKNHCRLLALIILPLLFITFPAHRAHAQEAEVSYQTFYDELAPYGQWVNDGQYGDVWVPNVAPGFRPYATDGHWIMTDNGNMWASDEPWSWACYHYGRWTYNGYYGWVWIPGYEWAPAWVSWRSGGGYYGWAPMGPGNVFGGTYEYPENYWVFVNPGYLYEPNVYNYYARGDAGMYMRQTAYLNYEGHDHYYYGPRRETIERETHHPVEVYRVSGAREAGAAHMGKNEVSIYRPAINRESEHSAHPASVVDGREHPIGHGEPVSANHEHAQPAFRENSNQQQQQQRQNVQRQNEQSSNRQQPNNQQQHNQQQNNNQQHNQQNNNNQQQHNQQQNNNQQQHNQQQHNQQQHTQPQPQQQQRQQPQPQQRSQPAPQQKKK